MAFLFLIMLVKVYSLGNNFFVKQGDGIEVPDHKSKVNVWPINLTPGSEKYVISSPKIGKRVEVLLTNIRDFDDAAYTLETWTTFYTCESGFNTAPGGSGAVVRDESVGTTAIPEIPTPVEFDTVDTNTNCQGVEWIDIAGSDYTVNTIKTTIKGILHVRAFYQLNRAVGPTNSVYFALREVDELGVEIQKIKNSLRVDKVNQTGLDGVGLDFTTFINTSVNSPRYFQIVMWASGADNVLEAVTIDGYTDDKIIASVHID